MRRNPVVLLLLLLAGVAVLAQPDPRAAMLQGIDGKRESYAGIAKQIWAFAEVGYQKAKAEFDAKRGPGFVYKTRLADRKPALDYRK